MNIDPLLPVVVTVAVGLLICAQRDVWVPGVIICVAVAVVIHAIPRLLKEGGAAHPNGSDDAS